MAGKSEEFKIKVVHKFLEIEDKKGALTQISKQYRIDIKTLKNWTNKYRKDGKISANSTQGRKSKFSQNIKNKINSILNDPQPMTSKMIQLKMGKSGQNISNKSLRNYLSSVGGKFKSVQKCPVLTNCHIRKRLEFVTEIKNKDYMNIIFSDECTFQTHSTIKKAWMLPNDQKKLWLQLIPAKFMFGAVFPHLDLDLYLFLKQILIPNF
jgi:transposase